MDKITSLEILKVLKKTNKSCPCEDEISYTDLKLIYPDCNLLSTFFNTILSSGVIPQSWKYFKTILIPKPGKRLNMMTYPTGDLLLFCRLLINCLSVFYAID